MTENANTIKTLEDLQNLLGDGYNVTLNASAAKTSYAWDKGTDDGDDGDGKTFDNSAAHAANTEDETYEYSGASLSLNIARKAEISIYDPLTLSLHVGADSTEENKISVDIESMSAKGLGINGLRVDGEDSTNADNAIDTIAAAIQKVSTQRSSLGAVQNRLEHTINKSG